jgi:ferrochelatase
VSDRLRELRDAGVTDVVVSPVGFVSDHMEVLFDLDVEAAQTARELGLTMVRAGAAGTHPAFVAMIRELISERLTGADRRAVGRFGPSHEVCRANCCLPGTGRPSPWDAEVTAPV